MRVYYVRDADINLIKDKPETWTDQEREVYKDKTMINSLMTNRICVIKEIRYKAETENNIMLVEDENKALIMGMVVSIAPDCRFGIGENGNSIPAAEIKAGDIVMYAVYNGDIIDMFGQKFFRVRDMDIHAKIPDSQLASLIIDKSDALWNIRKEMTYDQNNPNNIGPKSKLHIDNYSKKQENKLDKKIK